MNVDLDELERLAKAAPAGEWEEERRFGSNSIIATDVQFQTKMCVLGPISNQSGFPEVWFHDHVKEWIIAATPDTVSELIAEVRMWRERFQDVCTDAYQRGCAANGISHLVDNSIKPSDEDIEELEKYFSCSAIRNVDTGN